MVASILSFLVYHPIKNLTKGVLNFRSHIPVFYITIIAYKLILQVIHLLIGILVIAI